MASNVDFTLRLPLNVGRDPPSSSGPTTNLQSKISTLLLSSALTSVDRANFPPRVKSFFESPLCDVITRIWKAIFDAISSFFSPIWENLFGIRISTTYPETNQNFSKEALKKIYWGLGKENKWLESIDGRYHHLNDKYCFDKGTHGGMIEPGFIGSIEKTYTFVENFLNLKVNADWYLLLHKHTAAHFKGAENGTLMGQEKVGVFRDRDDFIHCVLTGIYEVTPEAMVEFRALDRALKNEFGVDYGLGEMTYTDATRRSIQLTYKPMSRDQVRRIFNKFLDEFYREVERATSFDEKLWAIARFQQRLEWLHPVRDGTSRTSTILMNKLLTDYGFHPVILEYPHVSSSYGLARWKQYLQNGLIKWEQERDRFNSMTVSSISHSEIKVTFPGSIS